MPSIQDAREYDRLLGLGITAVIALALLSAALLYNWTPIGTGLPIIVIGLLIYLFYRLVVAVEYLAYDS